MDKFGIFAAWVTIVAVLLAIPLSVIANILTPKVQVWWSKTSSIRLRRRINYVSSQLALSDEEFYQNALRDSLQCGIMAISLYIMSAILFGMMVMSFNMAQLGLQLLLSPVAAAAGVARGEPSVHGLLNQGILYLWSFGVILFLGTLTTGVLWQYTKYLGPQYRAEYKLKLTTQLAELQARL
jgi:hypothetical protein